MHLNKISDSIWWNHCVLLLRWIGWCNGYQSPLNKNQNNSEGYLISQQKIQHKLSLLPAISESDEFVLWWYRWFYHYQTSFWILVQRFPPVSRTGKNINSMADCTNCRPPFQAEKKTRWVTESQSTSMSTALSLSSFFSVGWASAAWQWSVAAAAPGPVLVEDVVGRRCSGGTQNLLCQRQDHHPDGSWTQYQARYEASGERERSRPVMALSLSVKVSGQKMALTQKQLNREKTIQQLVGMSYSYFKP